MTNLTFLVNAYICVDSFIRLIVKLIHLTLFLVSSVSLYGDDSNGLAPEITDLNAADISLDLERKIPYLKKAFISTKPKDRKDGIAVGELGVDSGDKNKILKFSDEILDDKHGNTDSFLIYHKGKLLFESYYKRGRINFPHYQMSITKSYTALALGRAMQKGYLSMDDLNKPVVSFLKEIDPTNLVAGAKGVTLHEAMHMRSGIRVDDKKAKDVRKTPQRLIGQGQIQTYMEISHPIDNQNKTFKYQGSDPSITMQTIEAVVPGTAKDFLKNDFLKKMGITNYGWQEDTSKLPKSAAGSSLRSRDMLKMGMLILQKGKWKGEQLVPAEFIEKATGPIDVNKNRTYGYFWWGHDAKVGEQTYHCISGRGAGGQFIMIYEELDLIIVVTSHNKGMGKMLSEAPRRIIPAFLP